jgi:myo-inositol-1(or 4)-monophosphatase
MEGDTRLVIDAIRQASRFLQRDFLELENLQQSEKDTVAFCRKACSKSLQVMCESLGKYYKKIIYDNKAAENLDFEDKAILIETMDGFENFTRAVPFFATMITVLVKKGDAVIPESSVINFPALGEVFYAEKGRGVYLERNSANVSGAFRVRVSGNSDMENILLALSRECFDVGEKFSSNIRLFDSYLYSLSLVLRGKADLMFCMPREISRSGIELFVSEAAGAVCIKGNMLMVSNFKLHEKIKAAL